MRKESTVCLILHMLRLPVIAILFHRIPMALTIPQVNLRIRPSHDITANVHKINIWIDIYMDFKIVCGLVLVLLALGLFQLYNSNKIKESLSHNSEETMKPTATNGKDSTVYNINEREIVINEVVDKHVGEPKPTSLKCNCWPLNNQERKPPHSASKDRRSHHKHTMHPHREENDSSHHIPTHKGYTKQIHQRDPHTGLIEQNGPKGAEPYQLISSSE